MSDKRSARLHNITLNTLDFRYEIAILQPNCKSSIVKLNAISRLVSITAAPRYTVLQNGKVYVLFWTQMREH